MMAPTSQVNASDVPKSRFTPMMVQFLMRLLAPGFALGAVVMLATCKSDKTSGYKYSYSSAFEFLLGANAIVFVVSLVSLPFSSSRPPKIRFFLMLDMVMMILMISACAAATAIYYVSLYGNARAGWKPICDNVGDFCSALLRPLITSYLTCLAFLVTTINSSNELKKIEASDFGSQMAPTSQVDASDVPISRCKLRCTPINVENALRNCAVYLTSYAVFFISFNKSVPTASGYKYSFSYSPAFVFLLGANVIALVFLLVSFYNVYQLSASHERRPRIHLVLMLDMAMMMLMISACAAAIAIYYVSQHGNAQTGWKPFCDSVGVGGFCYALLSTIVASYLTCLGFLVITINFANELRKIEASLATTELSRSGGA